MTDHARTVVCLHSGGFTSRQWRRLREVLQPAYRVLAPDLLGYGTSGAWPAGAPFHYQQDVDRIVAQIRELAGRVHLVGHSYGGFLACHVARAIPDLVASLALYEPVTFSVLDPVEDTAALARLSDLRMTWEPDASGVDEAWLQGFVDWWNGPNAWSLLPPETQAAFRAAGPKVFQEVSTLAADRTGAAGFATITAPALLMYGSLSPVTEQRTVKRLAAALPRSTLRCFEGVGHMAPISQHVRVNAAIADHLAGLDLR